jgi:hypothetical protein
MPAAITENSDGSISLSITFKPGSTMLDCETELQQALNEAGTLATGKCLERFDSDGAPIVMGGRKLTMKGGGRKSKKYQTPYGEVHAERYVYQSSAGGAQYCPVEANARIVRTATPLLAKQVAFKYALSNASDTVMDFAQHGRILSGSYVREIAGDVASIGSEKEEHWNYELPAVPAGKRVATVSIGTDGACALFVEDGWRQVMVGTIAFYDELGERLNTIYMANAPERGKGSFFERMEREVARVRRRYPKARYVGVADGAHDQWVWLEKHTEWQVLDFWHASEYLNGVAGAFGDNEDERETWVENACHKLKHHKGAVSKLQAELRRAQKRGVPEAVAENVEKTITYLENQKERMDYHRYQLMGLPIGSGVTEAACKCIAKQRLCGSGMRWQLEGAQDVLSLRAMIKSGERWEQFWRKTAQHGFSKISRRLRPSSKRGV